MSELKCFNSFWNIAVQLAASASFRVSEMKEAQKKKRQMKERHRQEDSISNAMVIWNNEILPHWDTVYVSLVLSFCEFVQRDDVAHGAFVCAGRERGGSGNCGGRDSLPVSEDECGASPSATSSTSHQVQTQVLALTYAQQQMRNDRLILI